MAKRKKAKTQKYYIIYNTEDGELTYDWFYTDSAANKFVDHLNHKFNFDKPYLIIKEGEPFLNILKVKY